MANEAAKALEALQVSKTKELKGTEKRDFLISLEKKYQQKWAEEKIFEVDAPSTKEVPLHSVSAEELRKQQPKWYGASR